MNIWPTTEGVMKIKRIHVNVWQKPLQYCNQPPTNKSKLKKKKNLYNRKYMKKNQKQDLQKEQK